MVKNKKVRPLFSRDESGSMPYKVFYGTKGQCKNFSKQLEPKFSVWEIIRRWLRSARLLSYEKRRDNE